MNNMRMCNPCLFYDDEDHIWRFYVNDNQDLMYSIMYDEDKWTKENKIDTEVLDFKVNFDMNNKIYIIYSISLGNLKYCVWEQNKWFGKTIYSIENGAYEITEISVTSIDNVMHIFFIGKSSIKKLQCSLIHLCLNKDENLINTIDTIPFKKEVFSHFQVQRLDNDNLSLIFLKHDKNEVAISFTNYKNNKWSTPKRLYGIIGSNVNFCTLIHFNKINVMNLSKEGSLHYLEHVLIEPDGKMLSAKIHESINKPTNFLLIEINEALCAIWTEGKNVLISSYKTQWSDPVEFYTELNNEISIYKYLSLNNKNNIRCNYILGTKPPEINLILPNYKNDDNIVDLEESNKENSQATLNSRTEEAKVDIKEELLLLQKNNQNLEKKLLELQVKYQQKLKIIEEYDDNFTKLTKTKKKFEERLNIMTEIQQASAKELAALKSENSSNDLIINDLKNKLQQLTNEYEALKKQKVSKDNTVNELKNKLQGLTNENESLRKDLKYERNIGIVDRILKKKPER
jgi:hypothetical protein